MKVSDQKSGLNPVTAQKPANSQAEVKSSDEASTVDKVSVEPPSPAPDTSALEAARTSASSARSARVQEVIRAVQSGQYYPSPKQIANQLITEAEVDARLRALIS
jgi:anti-sigma28 factor (negative regulator of flagellin synthesis)